MRLIETEIDQLKLKMLDLAELVQVLYEHLGTAVLQQDRQLANQVRKREQQIKKYDSKIDKRCSRILALHQPVANDLRFIFSVLKINNALERAGAAINNSARQCLGMQERIDPAFLAELRLEEMSQMAGALLSRSLRAFFNENCEEARALYALDDEIDALNQQAFELITRRIGAHPAQAADYVKLLLIVKNIEKIADIATDIAKETVYVVEAVVLKPGKMPPDPTQPVPQYVERDAPADDASPQR